ncbi:L,D-transpeptidase [Microbacterium allomyrinae]|uniref:L,D-transpeptidase n=1 Tax=Microbacterium allomyrinae TaxID=2830666 RepID=A0A9X1LU96_9MICO|nr:L,D-transpeptidase [Microbacterium allomyrinae]MCC2031863.1 L,D-transpeptidase [Microbacterium allomyrinae]
MGEGSDDADISPRAHAVSVAVPARRRRVIGWVLIGGIAMLVAGVIVVAALQLAGSGTAAPTTSASAEVTPTPTPTATPTPTPTPVGYPANTAVYDVTVLPQVNVFAVIPGLPVDDQPFAISTAERALPLGIGAPVWADPAGEPVAYLPRELPFDGTTVPVVERQQNWVKVLLVGRQAVPSAGDPSQVAGWLRTADVEFAPTADSVVVSISARTVDIVRSGVSERVATDFAWGADLTPTPLGRAYIMTTRVVPEYGYTRGHPIVYLSVQSPTLDGFGGADVAVTAFHYHDDRSGPISNGCIRLDPSAITALAALPLGTPVTISP